MKRTELALASIRVPVDFFMLFLAAMAAYTLRLSPYFTAIRPVIFDLTTGEYLTIILPVLLGWIGIFAVSGLYAFRRISIASEVSRVILASSTSMAVVFAILFFSRTFFESRFIALVAWGFAITFVVFGRLFIRVIQRTLLRRGIGVHNVVLIGKTDTAETLNSTFAHEQSLGLNVVAHFKTFSNTIAKQIRDMKTRDEVDDVILADPNMDRGTTLQLLSFTESEQLGFGFSADLFTAAVGRSVIHTYGGIPVIEVRKTPLEGWGAIYKRLFDIFASFLLIILTSPIMLLTAIAIKLDSNGPVFFSRIDDNTPSTRIGQNGKPFHYVKFRSMVPGKHHMRYNELADQDTRKDTPLVKIKNDPRITRVGRFIRKTSIDELPELFLVLIGTMSLVGPRPHLPEEVQRYKPEQKKVLTVKPGITGLAQISGRETLHFDEEVRLDTFYIEHWTPWLDLVILLKTPLVVLFRNGAT